MTFYKYAYKIETVGEIPSNLPKPQVWVTNRAYNFVWIIDQASGPEVLEVSGTLI